MVGHLAHPRPLRWGNRKGRPTVGRLAHQKESGWGSPTAGRLARTKAHPTAGRLACPKAHPTARRLAHPTVNHSVHRKVPNWGRRLALAGIFRYAGDHQQLPPLKATTPDIRQEGRASSFFYAFSFNVVN